MEQKRKNQIAYIIIFVGIIAFCISFFFLPIPENTLHLQVRSIEEQKYLVLQLARIIIIIGLITLFFGKIWKIFSK
jgi:uncharacterized membrane protein YhfC